MRLKYITDALTQYFAKKHPNFQGSFIGKESVEPTKVNVYKAYKVEIYWHLPGKNHLVFSQQMIDKCPEGQEDSLKERYFTALLEQILTNLSNIEYEVIQDGRV